MFKLHLKKYLKDNNLTRQDLSGNKTMNIPPLKIKTGLCKSENVTLETINKRILAVQE